MSTDIIDVSIIQIISLFLAIASLTLTIIFMVLERNKWKLGVPIAVWLLHGIIFYTFVLMYKTGDFAKPFEDFFTNWSAVLRLHLLVSMFSSLMLIINWKKLWNKLS